jgi:hypothetical protein
MLDRKLSDRLAPAQVNIGALTREELRESITAPAKLADLEFEPGLVERILNDVGREPGRLPLVEFALTELWQRREGSRLANRGLAIRAMLRSTSPRTFGPSGVSAVTLPG